MEGVTHYINTHMFDAKEFFSIYDFCELYDDQRDYTNEPFMADYGWGQYAYRYSIINIVAETDPMSLGTHGSCNVIVHDGVFDDSDDTDDRTKIKYIVAVLTNDEIEKIMPYCQCRKCQMWWFNPSKYSTCGCCCGCLKSCHISGLSVSQYIVRKTMEYMKDNQIVVDDA